MNKITKEQAEEWLGIAQSGLIGREYRDVFLKLPDILRGYLAQEEELEVVELEKHTMCEAWEKQNKIIEQLKAENHALRERYDKLEQSSQQIITDMAMEVHALKAKLEGTFKFDEPKRGEALRYVTDDETGVVRVKWETNHD